MFQADSASWLWTPVAGFMKLLWWTMSWCWPMWFGKCHSRFLYVPHSIDESCHPRRMQIVCLSEVLKIHHILTFFLCHQIFFSTFLRLFCFTQNGHVLFDNSHDTSCCCVPCLRAMVIIIIIIIIIIIYSQLFYLVAIHLWNPTN